MQKITTRHQTRFCGAPHVSEYNPLLDAPEVCICASCKNSSAKTCPSRMPETSTQALMSLDYSKSRAQKTILYAEEHQLDPKHKPSPHRLMLFALPRPLQKIVFWRDSVMHNMGVCDGVWVCLDRHQICNPFQQHNTRWARQGMIVWH